MTKLELLNVFLNDRLTAAAEDIFRAVRDTVAEYQSEILRSKEENERLKRLLNVAVQRLLLPSEPSSVPPPEDALLSESEWGRRLELLQVKEEPDVRIAQPESLQEATDSEQGNCSHAAQQTLHPEVVPSAPLPPSSSSTEIKAEDEQPVLSLSSPVLARSDCRATRSDSSVAAKGHRPQKTDLLCSNGKQSVHLMQIKNVRSLKRPLSRSTHQAQSIQRWHSCKECGKGFSFACQLEVHMRWHTKEKPYSCAVCRKSFTTVSMLKRHHRIHTGEKPFRCHVCGKCFNQSAHLNTHFRLHTRDRAGWARTSQCK